MHSLNASKKPDFRYGSIASSFTLAERVRSLISMTRRNERASQILESRAGCGVTSITGLVEHLRGRARRLDHDGDAGGLPRQAAGPVSVSSFCGGRVAGWKSWCCVQHGVGLDQLWGLAIFVGQQLLATRQPGMAELIKQLSPAGYSSISFTSTHPAPIAWDLRCGVGGVLDPHHVAGDDRVEADE